jgi:glycerol-3-phosphate dehydrogenase
VADRSHRLAALRDRFDMLVIGGGINGLAIAWDAALAGLRVAIVEKGDWGSGTSSWSSRMIHGGLKYLEKYDVPLVRESLRDREWLLRNAPHLVKPLPFVLPFYAGNAHSKTALKAGMIAYDVLSFDKSVPRHTTFTRDQTIDRLPGIRREGLQGAARYFDAQVAYAERLCVELMLGATAAGAVTLNHTEVESLDVEGDRVTGATVRDRLTYQTNCVRAELTVNVAGPWADSVLAGSPAATRRLIGGTKGTHLVVAPFPGAPHEAMYYESEDARPMMVIPWLGHYLIGSTDKHVDADLDTIGADDEEVDYILHETNKLFPDAGLSERSVLYSYTGVRPLPYVGAGRTADISRRHEIIDHAPDVQGLLSVVGGKLTTFRALARHLLKVAKGKLPVGPSRLSGHRLPGYPDGAAIDADDPAVAARLQLLYAGRARQVAEMISSTPGFERQLDEGLTVGEVVFVVRHEQAHRLADVLCRRTMVGLRPDLARPLAGPVAQLMAAELDWSAERIASELADYDRYLQRFRLSAGEPTTA